MVTGVSPRIQARRAIEALRAGVPNRDAVMELGSAHEHIVARFQEQLGRARDAETEAFSPSGFLVAGNFGTGKSHLLEFLEQTALDQRFVVSKVVISKETPLFDPVKVFRSAIRAASVPGRVGAALPQIASELHYDSPRYSEFYRWAHDARHVNQRFAATLYLHEYAQNNPEMINRIIAFWSGDPIQTGELRRALREYGQAANYMIEGITQALLAYHRFRFAARLMIAAGYSGWVLLFDEVDLVARYSFLQRAKSYAQIARWTGSLPDERVAGITSVMAITSAFESDILVAKGDRDVVPGRLNASTRPSDQSLAIDAERGMRLISNKTMLTLTAPSDEVINRTHDKVRLLHARAYDWQPPHAAGLIERTTSASIREYVRAWINEWDLRRLYPDYQPEIAVQEMTFDYSEDTDLAAPADGDPDVSDRDQ